MRCAKRNADLHNWKWFNFAELLIFNLLLYLWKSRACTYVMSRYLLFAANSKKWLCTRANSRYCFKQSTQKAILSSWWKLCMIFLFCIFFVILFSDFSIIANLICLASLDCCKTNTVIRPKITFRKRSWVSRATDAQLYRQNRMQAKIYLRDLPDGMKVGY